MEGRGLGKLVFVEETSRQSQNVGADVNETYKDKPTIRRERRGGIQATDASL